MLAPDQVRQALDGRHIPRHLLGDAPNPPSLKIAYSQHTDLNVKFQSHRSRCARPLSPKGRSQGLRVRLASKTSGWQALVLA